MLFGLMLLVVLAAWTIREALINSTVSANWYWYALLEILTYV